MLSVYQSASALRQWQEKQAIDRTANNIKASTGLNTNTTTDAARLKPMNTRGRTKIATNTKAKKPAALKKKAEAASRRDAIDTVTSLTIQ